MKRSNGKREVTLRNLLNLPQVSVHVRITQYHLISYFKAAIIKHRFVNWNQF
ncbi:hypothetical protein Hanom_Chr05g00402461 [Helianthus anomalus]